MNDENFISSADENESNPISFFYEDIDFELHQTKQITSWIKSVIRQYKGRLISVNFIFCSDSYLHQLNIEYLQHDTLTDIITFPYQPPPQIEGDIFVSVDRVRDNALIYKVSFEEELLRVLIHGILHLCGFKDKSETEKAEMHQKEDVALRQFNIALKSVTKD
jgi:rRNA maturation RNase YbeY